MTYSLIAHDRETGAIGLVVASRFFACGAVVPCVGARVAVASQAFCNPVWGTEGRTRLAAGEAAEAVLADFVTRDGGQAIRQAHMMDASGRFAAHTGADCVDWAGHVIGADHSVAGNMLVGPEVIRATSRAYAEGQGMPFPDRLLAAMRAGEAAGGDKRGRQAAGMLIHHGEEHAWLDIRADDNADPLGELERLWAVAQERYVPFTLGMATAENFSGMTDRAPVDAAIVRAEAERVAAGRPSLSLAVGGKG